MYNSLLVRAYLQKSLPAAGKLADFLSVIYLLTLVLKHATNHIQTRLRKLKLATYFSTFGFCQDTFPTLKKPKELKFPNARIE